MDAPAPARTDVLVLGAGVIGLACALQLLRAGRAVTVIDQSTAGSGSSHGNCGTITPSHAPPLFAPGRLNDALGYLLRADSPLYVRPRYDPALWHWLLRFARRCNRGDYDRATRARATLLVASRAALESLVTREGIACEWEPSGTLYAFRTAVEVQKARRLVEELGPLGIEGRLMDGAAARALEPALNGSIVGALQFPGDARLRPDRYVAGLAASVRRAGGTLLEHVRATGFSVENGRVASVSVEPADASKGSGVNGPATLAAGEVVVALGAWSPKLVALLGIPLPVQPGKGYSITYTRPGNCPRIPLVLKERGVCVTAWESGYRLGSTMEFSGYDSSLNRLRLDALKRGAAEYLHEPLGPELVEEWYGWRPMTFDELPVIGRSPRHDNLWLATGHGMLGVTQSALTAELLGALMTGTAPPIDAAAFAPARFA